MPFFVEFSVVGSTRRNMGLPWSLASESLRQLLSVASLLQPSSLQRFARSNLSSRWRGGMPRRRETLSPVSFCHAWSVSSHASVTSLSGSANGLLCKLLCVEPASLIRKDYLHHGDHLKPG